LNGGVYGGKARALEAALREVLAKQSFLRQRSDEGNKFFEHGRTHQYLWNQYFLERPGEITLDYGGAFVVNLAPAHIAPRLFGVSEHHGKLHSVLFQKTVCIGHANGGGYSDSTLQLIRTAAALRFDTVAFVGVQQDMMDYVARAGLLADLAKHDRILVDSSLCFNKLPTVASWQAEVTTMELLTPLHVATFQGMQFVALRRNCGPKYTKSP